MDKGITLIKFSHVIIELISKYGGDATIKIANSVDRTPVLSIYNQSGNLICSLDNDDLNTFLDEE
jgi:hypothetical protein